VTILLPGAGTTSNFSGGSRRFISASRAVAAHAGQPCRSCSGAASRTGSRPGRHDLIAIDGKRRTHDKAKGLKALHTLTAYATHARLALAQLSVPEKTNEITAIPELLDHLAGTGHLEGALVTIDAMGCQVEIADRITRPISCLP
jgi:Transposase DDE domain